MEDRDRISNSNNMFYNIKNNIGKKVIVLVCNKGNVEEYIGSINELEEYNSIYIDKRKLYFITDESAIIGIRLEDGDVLYYNQYVTKDYGTHSDEDNKINKIEIARLIFGNEKAQELENSEKKI